MAVADFASGVQGAIQQRLLRQMQQQALERQIANEQQDNARADRGLDLQAEQQAFTQGRLRTGDAAAAAEAEARGHFIGGLPAHLRPVAEAQTHGLKFDAHDLEDPAAHQAHVTADALRLHEGMAQIDAKHRPSQSSTEPLVGIMGPDGNPILVPRSQAINKRPASTREQGRSLTSGDAGRVADFDTSLHDLTALETDLGTTGAASKIGAMVPNVVSEFTGFGLDAKKRQGTIDRVKQVIGKTLEGGVLRKEDEYKYEKILPTIGDPPEVAASKLKNLRQAITLRRQTFLDDLGSANFDTSKFSAPAHAPASNNDPLGIR